MLNLNRVELIGHTGKVEIKTVNGSKFATINFATSERWTKDGERKDRTDWHRLVTFRPATVELIDAHIGKGDFLRVVGKLRSTSWEQDGETRYGTEIHIAEIGFLQPKDAGDDSEGAA